MLLASLALAAFLLGAVPFPYMISRLVAGIDIRDHGSGNPGASNVFRVVGPSAGIVTFILDCTKAIVAVKLAVWFLPTAALDMEQLIWFKIALGVLAVCGHVFSPFLGGRGGKGVATVIGVFWILFPLGLLTGALCGLAVIVVYRFFSLGSLVGVCALPVAYFLLKEQPWHPASLPILYLSLVATLLVLVRHTDNIKRLISG
ncbi:MAG: glycerol-3-phosphate acyltransferase, partial [Leptospirales bacterium]